MKKAAEQRTERALTQLLKTMEQNYKDTGEVLDDYESTHTDYELSNSKQYDALVSGHFALKEAIDDINRILNK